MTEAEHIAWLLFKGLEGQLSEAERIELEQWKNENPEQMKFFDDVYDENKMAGLIKAHHPEYLEGLHDRVLSKIEGKIKFKVVPLFKRPFFRLAVAACIAGLLVVGGYFMLTPRATKGGPGPVANTNDVKAPETNKARITLADGKVLAVDSLNTYLQGNVKITKTADGKIVYSGSGNEVVYNTLTNPRGSTVIDMTLSDGSHVWLNAESSITYPVAFTGSERKVSMKGEGYFKVTHNSSMPFTLTKDETSVTVLGTEFNVNAYDNEPDIKVTLVEGSVKLKKADHTQILKPGQQGRVSGDITVISNVDLEQVLAWKNGSFVLKGTDLAMLMRQVERWYDVDVKFEGAVQSKKFGGSINRNVTLSTMLSGLKGYGVETKLEGNVVTVLK
jgi:ferric-dicitrate binding protein FerR (iron transport regulator)